MINTTLCYIEDGSRYLMLHRTKKEGDLNRDKWIGIGGKFEDRETPYDCIRREMLEETGLVADTLEYRGIVTFISDRYPTEYMHLFIARDVSGTPLTDCDEGELAWIEKRDLYSLTLWEGDRIFLDLLDRDVPFFSLKLVYEGDRLVQHVLEYAK